MAIHELGSLVAHARERSPFYRELYAGVRALSAAAELETLPVVDQAAFWRANSLTDNRLLTGEMKDGVIFRSGGTTGEPKFSVFTREEWQTFTFAFGKGMVAGGLRRGERVANVFYAGSLYASFLFINESLQRAAVENVLLPVGGAVEPEEILKICQDFKADTLAGVPTSLLKIAHVLAENRAALPGVGIKRVIFGGESMYADQRRQLREIFGDIRIQSIGYASVDAGLLGFADQDCGPDEHRVFADETIMEILEEGTNRPVREPGVAGRLVVTNLTRRLMPIIRYPVGDRAAWVDAEGEKYRRFVILGRTEEGVRVGPVSLYYDDVHRVLGPLLERFGADGLQLVLDHQDGLDRLTVCLAVTDPGRWGADEAARFLGELFLNRPFLQEAANDGKIHPTRIEWVKISSMAVNARTGKLRRVVDRRFDAGRRA